MKLADLLPWKRSQQSNSNQPDANNLNEDPEANKIEHAIAVEVLKPTLPSTVEQLAALNRWILATLITINGGGIVTLIAASQLLQRDNLLLAAKAFITGITSALLSAILSVILSSKAFRLLGETLGYYVTVAHDGERCEVRERQLSDLNAAVKRRTLVSQSLAIASMIAFLIGIYFAIAGVNQQFDPLSDSPSATHQSQIDHRQMEHR